jgi:two-component system cell cycle response regulator DivK
MSKSPTRSPARAKATDKPRAKAGGVAARSHTPLVLVVDDFPDNREMYSEYLAFEGYRVIQAADGEEALNAAFAHLPDVILMDLSLPDVDGWEATRRLKADARTKKIPVMALTGHALAGHAQGARDAGCDAFITKPCLPEDLVTQVKKLLAARSKPAPSKRRR